MASNQLPKPLDDLFTLAEDMADGCHTQPFPTAHTVWTYRAIYQVNDARVGVWSQSVSVAVPA
jgi:hypothetical protein